MTITDATIGVIVAVVQWLALVSTASAAPWVVGFSTACWVGGWNAAKNAFWPSGFARAMFFGATAGGLVWLLQAYVLRGGV